MRKICAVFSLVMILCLTACASGNDAPGTADLWGIQEQAETETPTTTATMTAKDFCKLFEGTWISNDGQLVYIGFQTETGEPLFVWGIENSDAVYGPGTITNFEVLGDNEFKLTVSFSERDGADEFSYDAFESNVHIMSGEEGDRLLTITIENEPEVEYFFDFGDGPGAGFETAEDFWEFLLTHGESQMLINPDNDDYVQFFYTGASPGFLFGNLAFNENSGEGEIQDMTLEAGNALAISVLFPETMGNGGSIEAAKTATYTIHILGELGVTVYFLDKEHMGDFYFGVG